jgi:hypothetical protein
MTLRNFGNIVHIHMVGIPGSETETATRTIQAICQNVDVKVLRSKIYVGLAENVFRPLLTPYCPRQNHSVAAGLCY